MTFPLDGLQVLDFSRVVAGPFATRLLADLGADVVKVEPPDGDLLRTWGDQTDEMSGYFSHENASKRDISVDFKAEGATELLLELVAKADMVVENYRPGVMGRFGLDYEACRAVNPSIIYLSISGFGQTSSWSQRPAYAPIIHAEAGLLDRQSACDGRAPTNPVLSIADTNAGLHGLVGLLSALWMRERTGLGQHIDISMMAAMTITDDYAHWALDDIDIRPLGGTVRPTGYGHIMIAGDLKSTWYQINTAGLVTDGLDGSATVPEKIAAREAALDAWFGSFTKKEDLQAQLDELKIVWGDVRKTHDVFDTDIASELELSVELEHPSGPRRVAQSPYRFSNAEAGARSRAPYRGEHNAAVIADWLGDDHEDNDSKLAAATERVEGLMSSGVLQADVPAVADPNRPT